MPRNRTRYPLHAPDGKFLPGTTPAATEPYKRTTVERPCEQCGTPFQVLPSELKVGKGRFCGASCVREARRLKAARPELLTDRFWSKVDRGTDPQACWLWTAGVFRAGYGHFSGPGGQDIKAHRFSWELHRGPIPNGLWVLHNCPDGDNPRCVNPDHLWLGTNTENTADREAKGRTATGDRSGSRLHPERLPRGSDVAISRLTEVQVLEIRRRYAAGGVSQTALAEQFSVTQTAISLVIRRRTWRHV